MGRNLLIAVLIIASIAFAAEIGHWEKSMGLNLNFSMSNFSENWEGGDAGAINWVASSDILLQKQVNEWFHNKNTLKLSFGQTHSQDVATKNWRLPQKSDDLIELESVGRFTLETFVDPYAAVKLESQFLDGRVADNKRLFNPMKLTESAGIARVFFKNEHRELTSRLGFGIRQDIDRDVMTAPDEFETKTVNDGGIEWVTELRLPLADNKIKYSSKLALFKALYSSEAEELESTPHADYWKAPDINWENRFSAKITEYIAVNLRIQLLYDKEIDLKGRHSEILAFGFTYNLF